MSESWNTELIETVNFKLFKPILDEGYEFTLNHLLQINIKSNNLQKITK